MTAIDCVNCGAPLEVASGAGVVRCGYCNTSNRIEPVPTRHPVHMHVHGGAGPRAAGSRAVALAAGFVAVAVMIAVVVAVVLNARPTAPSVMAGADVDLDTLNAQLASAREPHWDSSSAVCPVDLDGDGVLDFAGLSGPPGQGHALTLMNGESGQTHWQDDSFHKDLTLECASSRWVVVGRSDFELRVYDVRAPDTALSVRGSDALRAAVMGRECVAARMADGAVLGVSLPTGTPTACDAKFPGRADVPGIIGLTDQSTALRTGDRTLRLTKRRPGTPMLTLEIAGAENRESTVQWPLSVAATTFSAGVAAGDETIVVFGARPAERNRGVLVGVDPSTGTSRYAVDLKGGATNSITAMVFNGRYVVVQYWTYLKAFDPNTGERAW